MINILREINSDSSMKDMVINVINNIEFYIEHRDKLADIHLTNDYLNDYLKELYQVLDLYEKDSVPSWFKNFKPYRFLSGNFPYNNPLMEWCFGFKDLVDVMLEYGENSHIITIDKVSINGKIISKEEWKALKT